MRTKRIIWIACLATVSACSDPEPIYNEGEILWHMRDVLGYSRQSDMHPLLTPDSKYMIYLSAAEQGVPDGVHVRRVDIATGVETFLAPYGDNLDISPDGEWLLLNCSATGASRIKINGDSLATLPVPFPGGCYSPTWSPDSKAFAYIYRALGPVGLYVFANDVHKFIAVSHEDPDFFPDGRRIISVIMNPTTQSSMFLIHDWTTKQELAKLDPSPGEFNRNPQVSPDGKRILYENSTGIYIMNADGSGASRVLPSTYFYPDKKGEYLGFVASSPSWYPDGKYIVYQHIALTHYAKCQPRVCLEGNYLKGPATLRMLRVHW